MRRFTGDILVMSGVGLLVFGNIAGAAGPTQADFDVCNREAHAQAASPRTTSSGANAETRPGTPVSQSAAPAANLPVTPSQAPTSRAEADIKSGTPVSPSAAPVTETPATPSPSTQTGPGTGRITDSAASATEAKLSSPSASPQTQGDAKTGSSATAPQAAPSPQTADEARVANQADQLRGIADKSKDDPTYQQAYRDCMKGRGF
jgi:hypothetical protein